METKTLSIYVTYFLTMNNKLHSATRVLRVLQAKLLQSRLTFCDPMDHSLPGSSDHRILQARILKWVASFRGSTRPKDQTYVSYVSCIGRWLLYHLAPSGKPATRTSFLQRDLLIYNSYTIQFVHIKVQFNSFGTFTQLGNYHQNHIKTFLSAQREISYPLGFIPHFLLP